jgi:hypothetical protein
MLSKICSPRKPSFAANRQEMDVAAHLPAPSVQKGAACDLAVIDCLGEQILTFEAVEWFDTSSPQFCGFSTVVPSSIDLIWLPAPEPDPAPDRRVLTNLELHDVLEIRACVRRAELVQLDCAILISWHSKAKPVPAEPGLLREPHEEIVVVKRFFDPGLPQPVALSTELKDIRLNRHVADSNALLLRFIARPAWRRIAGLSDLEVEEDSLERRRCCRNDQKDEQRAGQLPHHGLASVGERPRSAAAGVGEPLHSEKP